MQRALGTTLQPAQPLPARHRALARRAPRRRTQRCSAEPGEDQQHEPPAAAAATEPPPPPPPSDGDDNDNLQLPREAIQRMRDTVFSYDSFFVTSVENYQADGVLFRGNLRGDAAAAYAKLSARLKGELGEQYKLYLLQDKEEKPVAVVLPVSAVRPQASSAAEAGLAALLGAAAVATTLNINGAELFNAALLTAAFDPAAVAAAVPGTLAFLAILAAHEAGHVAAARQRGVELAPPVLIPAGIGLLGSLGAITRIKSFVPDRAALAAVASAGPLWSSALSAAVMLAGAALTAGGQGGIELDVASFRESLLAGTLGQAVFGDQLFQSDAVDVSPLFVAGWAGLIVNAINMLPVGELDGGRTYLGLCGRQALTRMGSVTLLLLGLAGFSNSLALFWLLLVLTLQRGPIPPCDDELSLVEGGTKAAAIAALVLPLTILLPYPLAISIGESGLPDLPATF